MSERQANAEELRVLVDHPGLGRIAPAQLDAMFRLRCKVFHELCGWRVSVAEGRERDAFDTLSPCYLVVLRGARVVGCVRLLRTTGPTMLRDVFPGVLDGAPPPASPRIWESTRFAVDPDSPARGGGPRLITSSLLAGIYEVGLACELEAFVSVFSRSMGRVLRRAGCVYRPLGAPLRSDGDTIEAGLFPVGPEQLAVICRKAGIVPPLGLRTARGLGLTAA